MNIGLFSFSAFSRPSSKSCIISTSPSSPKLFTEAQMGQIPEGEDYKSYLNPESLVIAKGYAERALLEDNSGIAVQFERVGYFFKDPDSTADHFVFNKTTALKDSFKF
ncbi:MAG: hypothetical protein E7115_02405 [Bacteroidales bacterium]|nr:hypothetical protein [Bacteroidales bacterium]